MSAHTPGPWRVKIKSGRACVIADKAPDEYRSGFQYKLVAQCGTTNQKEANARLIAAAPDLLGCLSGFVLNAHNLGDKHFEGVQERLVKMSRAAIAKAKGEPDAAS